MLIRVIILQSSITWCELNVTYNRSVSCSLDKIIFSIYACVDLSKISKICGELPANDVAVEPKVDIVVPMSVYDEDVDASILVVGGKVVMAAADVFSVKSKSLKQSDQL